MTEQFLKFQQKYESSLKEEKDLSKLDLSAGRYSYEQIKFKNLLEGLKISDIYNLVVLSNNLEQQHRAQQKENLILKKEIQEASLKAELEMKKQITNLKDQSNKICEELKAKITLLTNQTTTQSQIIEQLESNLLELKSNNQLSTNNQSKLQKKCDQLKIEVSNLSENNNQLKQQLNDSKSQYQIEIDELQSKKNTLEQQSQSYQALINDLKDKLNKSKEQIENVQQEFLGMKKQIQEASQKAEFQTSEQITNLKDQVLDYQSQLAAQNNTCDELNAKINILTNQNMTQAQTISQLESNVLELNNANQLSNDQVSKLQNQCDQLKTELSNLSEHDNKLKQQFNDSKSQYQIELDQLQSIKNTLEQQSQNQQAIMNDLKEKMNRIREQNENLLHDLLEYNKFKKEKEEQDKYNEQKKLSEYNYDLVILMKSVFDLGKQDKDAINQFQNNVNKDSNNRIQQEIDERNPGCLKIIKPNPQFNTLIQKATIVGFQGLRNRGKTYLLNCLINESFPSGHHENTPGICLKYHSLNNSNVVYMDSGGLNQPVYQNSKKSQNYIEFLNKKNSKQELEAEELKKKLSDELCKAYQDLKVTEQIQQDFIVENSDVLIVVVSQLTLDDQKLIHQLSDKFVDKFTQIPKKIIVVHNLTEFRHPNYIEQYMDEIMQNFHCYKKNLNNYQLEKEFENRTVLVDELKSHVNHVFMGHSKSQSDNIYNRFALHFIRNEIEYCQRTSHFDVTERFTKYLNLHLNDHVVIENSNNSYLETVKDSSNFVSYNSESQCITLSDNWKIKKIKDLQMNVFGSIQKDCFYSIYDSKDGDIRYLIVELPGNIDILEEYNQKNGQFHLVVKYQKEDDDLPELVYRTTRKKEEKNFYITVCDEDQMYQFNSDDSEDLENGMYKFSFSKVKQKSLEKAKIKKANKK
ncbi:hypothetical protein ABPG72_010498 [Tetrahymena utriculariae]